MWYLSFDESGPLPINWIGIVILYISTAVLMISAVPFLGLDIIFLISRQSD